jgi:hypothetical protein
VELWAQWCGTALIGVNVTLAAANCSFYRRLVRKLTPVKASAAELAYFVGLLLMRFAQAGCSVVIKASEYDSARGECEQ